MKTIKDLKKIISHLEEKIKEIYKNIEGALNVALAVITSYSFDFTIMRAGSFFINTLVLRLILGPPVLCIYALAYLRPLLREQEVNS